MADNMQFVNPEFKQKSFWKRPEGITGTLFMAALVLGGGYLLYTFMPILLTLASNILYLSAMLVALGALLYVVLDPKMRNLIWYGYKSAMRWITGVFVNLDPIGILKTYVEDLENNLGKMRKQIGILRGQMRKLQTLMEDNNKEIDQNMKLAGAARDKGMDQQMLLSSRKAARLQESNSKYQALLQKMELLNRILVKMHDNSEILLEDTRDQVQLKEQERKAIRTSHSAMRSAMSVISGDPDKRAMFDMAMEAVADDVANKVGEMERFMEMSANFMNSIDLQNGVFEEQGMQMLEKWEKESTLMLLNDTKKSSSSSDILDLNSLPVSRAEQQKQGGNSQYDNFFS
jgi:predicted  nucleic acid-binding Zn-ribbon protein